MLSLCPICADEFFERLSECPSCGCSLVPSSLEKTSKRESGQSDGPLTFVELCRPSHYAVAMLIKQMLEQNGVPAWIKGGHSLTVLPHLMFGGELRILVEASQHEYAWNLYQAYFEGNNEEEFLDEE